MNPLIHTFRKFTKFFLTVGLILSWTSELYAQSLLENIYFNHITIPGTIKSSQITKIVQDKYGYLWFGGNGLFRYDGLKFINYHDIENEAGDLSSKETDCLFYDSINNKLIIGTRSFGLVRYDYTVNKLRKLPTAPDNDVPIINDIAQTADGRIWAISFNSGLWYLQNDTLKKFSDPNHLINQPTSLLAHGSTLYVGQVKQIDVIENKKIVNRIDLHWQNEIIPPYTRVTALRIDRQHNLWIGTEKQGVMVYHLKLKKFIHYFKPTQPPFFSRITAILEDSQGLIWMTTKAHGLAVYNYATNELKHFANNPSFAQTLSSDNCFSVMEDRCGIIWIAGTGDINMYDRQKVNIAHIRYNAAKEPSLSDNMVRGVYEDRSEKVWIGTDGGVVNIFDRKSGKVDKMRITIPGMTGNFVPMYFLEIDASTMLIGTSLGLLQFNRATKAFAPFTPLWKKTKGNMVRQLVRFHDNIYILFGGSLLVYNLPSKQYFSHPQFGNSPSQNATVLHVDHLDQLWVGVRGGLAYFQSATGKFKFLSLQSRPSIPGSSLAMILSVYNTGNRLYLGTFNYGLWELDVTNLNTTLPTTVYTEKEGLPNNTVYSSLPDKDGNLWLSTNSGLVKFNPVKKHFVQFTVSDGLQNDEFNRLAFCKSQTGEMIFGGINGINIFRPEKLSIPPGDYQPVITGIEIFNLTQDGGLQTTFSEAKNKLTLSYNQNSITFQFLVPNYREPRRFQTQYKLTPLDPDWRDASYDYSTNYAHLQPGSYTFTVKTTGNDGSTYNTTASFVIKPPIWKTWWFITLTILVIAFLIMTIIRSYIRKAQFDKQHLEKQLKLHTAEIEKSREELMALNQKKDLIFSILSHDLRSPLTTLKGFLSLLVDNVDLFSKEDIKKHVINIRHSVTNSLDLIDNTLFWSLSQMGNIQYNPKTFDLHPLLIKIIELYQLTAEKKKIQVTLNCNGPLMVYADENMIYVTLRNLLSNGIKFTPEGKAITITGTCNNETTEVSVIDEGIGMSQEYLNKVLSLDQPMLKTGTSNEKGTGLGLLLCKNFLEINNGTLHINSVENEGTTFIITLPQRATIN